MNQVEDNRHPLAPTALAVGTAQPLATPAPDALEIGTAAPNPTRRALSLSALWRYKWTMLIVTFLLAPIGVVGAWLSSKPEYESSAEIHVGSKMYHLVYETEESGQIPSYERYLRTQANIMRSPALLERLKDREDVRRTAWYNAEPSFMDKLLDRSSDPFDRLNESLRAEPVRGTEVLEVSMTTPNPRDAAVIVNALVAEYMSYISDQFTSDDKRLLDELQQDERTLKSSIAFSSDAAARARRLLGTSAPDTLVSQQRVRLDQVEGELHEMELELDILTRQRDALVAAQAATSQPAEVTPPTVAYHQDPEWRRLKDQLDTAQRRLEEVSEQFEAQHPMRKQAEMDAKFARNRLTERELVLDELPPSDPSQAGNATANGDNGLLPQNLNVVERRIQQMQMQREIKENSIARMREEYKSVFEAAETLRTESENVTALTERLDRVQQRQRELLEKGRVPPSVRPISAAAPASRPANAGKRIKLSLMAVCGALAAGLGAAYVRFALDPHVAEADDVHRNLHSPFLGYLPVVSSGAKFPYEVSAAQSEAIRVVRTALLHRLHAAGGNMVQITSADQGSGKSTVAILLARSLAQLGKRVLLVDGDVRRPTLERHFELQGHPGLLSMLKGATGTEAIVPLPEIPSLSVLPAGRTENTQDVELLANGKFSAMLQNWRDEYDFTIVDGPPLWGSADAGILSRQVDGTVLVVRGGHCRRSSLADGLAMFAACGGRMLGTVFVGMRASGTYYGQTYGYGYGYGYGADGAPHELETDARDVPTDGRA